MENVIVVSLEPLSSRQQVLLLKNSILEGEIYKEKYENVVSRVQALKNYSGIEDVKITRCGGYEKEILDSLVELGFRVSMID